MLTEAVDVTLVPDTSDVALWARVKASVLITRLAIATNKQKNAKATQTRFRFPCGVISRAECSGLRCTTLCGISSSWSIASGEIGDPNE